tara:strand:+ start:23090 stop:24742 length:1653 start_codon:yes stop_codon:yes gene_type:complete
MEQIPEIAVARSLEFTDPYELLLVLDDNLLEGKEKLHKWQMQFMLDFAAKDWTSQCPFKAAVRAANGSGKDKYIIAACVVWFSLKYTQAVSIVTSASGTQLDRQTNKYIQQLAEQCNAKIDPNCWKINYRHYECQISRSTIELFVTDEAGRAEGWHPIINDGKLAIFTSEAKSIPDEIFTALARCTGFTHRVDVSSPGLPMGHFFNVCTGARNRKDLDNISDANGGWVEYHITAYDCSHLSLAYIEELKTLMPGGENGAAFKSCVLAEFGTTDEMTVIAYQHIWRSVNRVGDTLGWLSEPVNTGGLDLSAGGDETVLSVRNGNKLLKVIPFRFNNTQDTVNFLVEKFKEHGLDKPNAFIYADAGGLGKPIIDQLRSKGWTNIRYVLNQNKAYNDRVYINRGAEMWFNFGKLLETGEAWLCQDDRLVRQLSTRYYKITEGNKHKLESKLQARAAGRPSPDRADSVVLCYSQYKSKLTADDSAIRQEYKETPEDKEKAENEFKSPLSIREWAKDEFQSGYFTGHTAAFISRDISRLKRLVKDVNNSRQIVNI